MSQLFVCIFSSWEEVLQILKLFNDVISQDIESRSAASVYS